MVLVDREEVKQLIELAEQSVPAVKAASSTQTATCEEPPMKKAKGTREAILGRLFQEEEQPSRDGDAGAVIAAFVQKKQARAFQSLDEILMCVDRVINYCITICLLHNIFD